jgi:glycosyltransferase involved in cell wall biosynthesis
MRVVVATPSLGDLTEPYMRSLAASASLVEAAGHECLFVREIGNPYISAARATMLRKAMDGQADVVLFLDYDLSWKPDDLLTLIETEGDVVAGTYRFKKDDEEYMGAWETDETMRPVLRDDGCFKATRVPAGFLKVTMPAVRRFMAAYPELVYGDKDKPSVDLFNHGAIDGVWWGEDYAFCKRWIETGGDIWLIPHLDIGHHSTHRAYPGNLHEFMMRQPGGSKAGRDAVQHV